MMGHEQRVQLPTRNHGDFGMVFVLMCSLADTKRCFAVKGGNDDLQWHDVIEFIFDMPLSQPFVSCCTRKGLLHQYRVERSRRTCSFTCEEGVLVGANAHV